MIIIKKSSGSGRTVQRQIVYCDKTASVKSRAAYVLLRDKLLMQDEDFIENCKNLWDWLDIREVYLKRIQKENNGNLRCDYCGREYLDIGGKRPQDLEVNNKNKNLATVDHIIAKVDGGDKYNEDNMCVACKKCNGKKGKLTLENFLDRMTPENLRKVSKFLIERVLNKSKLENKILTHLHY